MSEIKVGDKVLYDGGGYAWTEYYEILTVERETKTQWILDNGTRFSKDRLRRVGGSYGAKIEVLTPDAQAKYDKWRNARMHQKLWRDIQGIKQPFHLSVKRLKEIYDELIAPENK